MPAAAAAALENSCAHREPSQLWQHPASITAPSSRAPEPQQDSTVTCAYVEWACCDAGLHSLPLPAPPLPEPPFSLTAWMHPCSGLCCRQRKDRPGCRVRVHCRSKGHTSKPLTPLAAALLAFRLQAEIAKVQKRREEREAEKERAEEELVRGSRQRQMKARQRLQPNLYTTHRLHHSGLQASCKPTRHCAVPASLGGGAECHGCASWPVLSLCILCVLVLFLQALLQRQRLAAEAVEQEQKEEEFHLQQAQVNWESIQPVYIFDGQAD